MGIGEFLFGKRQEQPIDKIGESEQNTVNQEGAPEQQKDLFEEALKKEKAMAERAKGRKRRAAGFMAGLSMLVAAPAYGQDAGAEFLRGMFGLGRDVAREVGSTVRNRENEATRRYESDRRFDERKVEAGTRQRESDNRVESDRVRAGEYTHESDNRRAERQYEVGGRVAETTTAQEEQTRREGYRYGAHEVGSKTEIPGPYGKVRRERSSDVVGGPQIRGQVPTTPLPGEGSESREARSFGDSRPLTERDRDGLVQRAREDHEIGHKPSPAFYDRMTEEERQVYGHAWNETEAGSRHKTHIILRPSDLGL